MAFVKKISWFLPGEEKKEKEEWFSWLGSCNLPDSKITVIQKDMVNEFKEA